MPRSSSLNFQVINLKRRPDRLETFCRTNEKVAGLSFSVVEAADGEQLDRQALRRDGILAADADYPDGLLGASVSHHGILQQAASGVEPATFCCEDDAIFHPDFAEQWAVLEENLLPEDWDFVLFGYNFDSATAMELIPGVVTSCSFFGYIKELGQHDFNDLSVEKFRAARPPVLWPRLVNSFGLPAYAVSPSGARRLLDSCYPLAEVLLPVPALRRRIKTRSLGMLINREYRHLQSFAAVPPLVITRNEYADSDTRKNQ